jgi:prolipoprotein diacylglyceryltransferase
MLLPVLAGTARLAFVALGGMLVLYCAGSLAALFGVIAGGLAVFGGLTALAVYQAHWTDSRHSGALRAPDVVDPVKNGS